MLLAIALPHDLKQKVNTDLVKLVLFQCYGLCVFNQKASRILLKKRNSDSEEEGVNISFICSGLHLDSPYYTSTAVKLIELDALTLEEREYAWCNSSRYYRFDI